MTATPAGPRVLWIDDDLALMKYASTLLVKHGFRVEWALDGSSGLAALERTRFDLLVIDLQLPDMSGLELLARIRNLGIDIHVLVLTAQADVDVVLAAGALGAASYKQKPLIGVPLIRAIADALDSPHTRSADSPHAVGATLALVQGAILVCDQPEDRERLSRTLARALADPGITLLLFLGCARSLRLLERNRGRTRKAALPGIRRSIAIAAARQPADLDRRVGRVVAMLEDAGPTWSSLSAASVATALDLDPSSLWRLLQQELGASFAECRRTVALRPVLAELATGDAQVRQIAYRHGYEHPSHLDRHFRTVFGISPSRYRELVRKTA